VYLKSLTLRGFKSFADKTTLSFAPGVAAVVGPNGSGKSNVVDAIAWVLGSHRPKSLRGGAMADVVFSGSPTRSALGQASVELVLDNSDGALPVEFTEVSVRRSMFATGETTYELNGAECRLRDVQELLGDTGLGEGTHALVGQGRLEAVLEAKPEERRAFIEEAAGVLKHRRRKDRAVRRLSRMDAHTERLADIVAEVERSLGPLEQQARAAARDAELRAERAEVRRVRGLRQLAAAAERNAGAEADRAEAESRIQRLEADLSQARAEEAEHAGQLEQLGAAVRTLDDRCLALSRTAERAKGLTGRIDERRRGLRSAARAQLHGPDADELRSQADADRSALAELEQCRTSAQERLARAELRRQGAEQAQRAHADELAQAQRVRAEAVQAQLRWEGEVASVRSSLEQAERERERLADEVDALCASRDELSEQAQAADAELAALAEQREQLRGALDDAEATVAARTEAVETAAAHERQVERDEAAMRARVEALEVTEPTAPEATAAVVEAGQDQLEGVRGPLADLVRPADGMGSALSAALGALGDAVVVDSPAAAEAAVSFAKSRECGRALVFVAGAEHHDGDQAGHSGAEPPLATGGAEHVNVWPLEAVLLGDPVTRRALLAALGELWITDGDWPQAVALFRERPQACFVTRDGDLAGPQGHAGGSMAPGTAVALKAELDRARAELTSVGETLATARKASAEARTEQADAVAARDDAAQRLASCDERTEAARAQRERLGDERRSCAAQLETREKQRRGVTDEIASHRQQLLALGEGEQDVAEARPDGGGGAPDGDGGDSEEEQRAKADRLESRLAAAREAERAARAGLATVEREHHERTRRAREREQAAEEADRRAAELEARQQDQHGAARTCDRLLAVAEAASARTDASLAEATTERDALRQQVTEREQQRSAVRSSAAAHEKELAGARDELRRAELAAQRSSRDCESVRSRLWDELETDPDAALAEAEEATFGGGSERDAELAESEKRLDGELAALGPVNPLAVAEHERLADRHRFLSNQLEDLRASRRDLASVIEAVDERIEAVFADAFSDVAQRFTEVFPRLFPGGEGSLALTDPDDPAASGVEVLPRPPGKRVRRLSLLSGGERAMTALALLFAIFAARPAPFYILDEVEAALDEANLRRFLSLLEDFRPTSQLLLVTHQRPTMEAADALYGVTMGSGGVSTVVTQRAADVEPGLALAAGS
jgi:chromosome segregation protein